MALCFDQVCMPLPVEVLQILAVLPNEAANTDKPSAESTVDVTTASCVDKVCTHSPVMVLQMLAVTSYEAVSTDSLHQSLLIPDSMR